MTGELRITDRVGDPEINNIIRQHQQRLLAAGIQRLDIDRQRLVDEDIISITPGKLHGYWTGDKRPADEAMQRLQQDLLQHGISSRVQELAFPPAEIFITRPLPPTV